MTHKVLDYINGQWTDADTSDLQKVLNPAEGAMIAEVVMTPKASVAQAVDAAKVAFREWRMTPAANRIQYLFKFKMLLEEHLNEPMV